MQNPLQILNRELIKKPIKRLKCARLVHRTVNFNLASTGVVKVGLMIDFGNFTIAESDQGITLTITPSFDLIGQILSWNLDDVRGFKRNSSLFSYFLDDNL